MDEMDKVAGEAMMAGEELQAGLDSALPSIRGMFSQTSMNALVDAANDALESAGFEGDYPEFDSDVTEFPSEFIRLLMMLSDAAGESGAGVSLEMSGIEDDRDVAMLASQVKKLAQSPEFQKAMSAGADVAVEVEVAPGMSPGGMSEEALMMERM
tara:strand:- start:3415 stop:3879 length:465 start_codon:yes stop_codon:yes gene_type:complete